MKANTLILSYACYLLFHFQMTYSLMFFRNVWQKPPIKSRLNSALQHRPVNFKSLGDVVQFGKTYFDTNHHIHFVDQLTHKVPGCASVVRLNVELQISGDNQSTTNTTISIIGCADSLVAQGLLAMLCNVSVVANRGCIDYTDNCTHTGIARSVGRANAVTLCEKCGE